MSKFKVGAMVRVVDGACTDMFSTGDLVRITAAKEHQKHDTTYYQVNGNGAIGWDESRFAPVETTPPSRDWQEHPTGALRESKEGKGRQDLLLAGYPRALKALSKHMDCELGRERNWEKGLPESSFISSAFRHLLGYTSGVSEDTAEYNLVALLWNVMCLVETYYRVGDGVMPEELLDIRKEINDENSSTD